MEDSEILEAEQATPAEKLTAEEIKFARRLHEFPNSMGEAACILAEASDSITTVMKRYADVVNEGFVASAWEWAEASTFDAKNDHWKIMPFVGAFLTYVVDRPLLLFRYTENDGDRGFIVGPCYPAWVWDTFAYSRRLHCQGRIAKVDNQCGASLHAAAERAYEWNAYQINNPDPWIDEDKLKEMMPEEYSFGVCHQDDLEAVVASEDAVVAALEASWPTLRVRLSKVCCEIDADGLDAELEQELVGARSLIAEPKWFDILRATFIPFSKLDALRLTQLRHGNTERANACCAVDPRPEAAFRHAMNDRTETWTSIQRRVNDEFPTYQKHRLWTSKDGKAAQMAATKYANKHGFPVPTRG